MEQLFALLQLQENTMKKMNKQQLYENRIIFPFGLIAILQSLILYLMDLIFLFTNL